MFAIQLLPPSVHDGDGKRVGRITIGEFTELFGCYPSRGESVRRMAAQWRVQLRHLIRGDSSAVALVTGQAAWIGYRIGKRCYIQQRYFITPASRTLSPRETRGEDGQRISEWSTRISDIARFLTPRPNHALQRTEAGRRVSSEFQP